MDETVIVLMLKNTLTGFLDKEIGFLKILENEDFITNTFVQEENGKFFVHLKLSTSRDVEEWEFSAIYDYYDLDCFGNQIIEIKEDEDCFNPTWEIIMNFSENMELLGEEVGKILDIHKNELLSVYKVIEENKNEYL